MTEQTDRTGRGQMVRAPAANAAIQPADTLAGFLDKIKGELARALPKHLTADRLARVALTAIRTTPHLAECTQPSFAACIMACAALGLEPNTPLGQAYLIPRKNKRNGNRYECSLIIGFQGQMDLARRSGMIAGIQAVPVFQGDKFRYSMGLHPELVHEPSEDPNREDGKRLTHVYAIVRLKEAGADPIFVVLSRAQIEARRLRGASNYASTPWDTDYIAMAQKTAIREVFKWAPRSAEIARAETVDQSHDDGRAPFAALPDDSARALLGSGIEATDDGEVLDGELDSSPAASRDPGSDDA